MTGSAVRNLFSLLYEHLGLLVAVSCLRALPWLAPILWLTFVPPSRLGEGDYAQVAGLLGAAAWLLAPALTAAGWRLVAPMAEGRSPNWRELMQGPGRVYPALLVWNLLQLPAAVLLVWAWLSATGPDEAGFLALLALAGAAWLWLLLRLLNFVLLPLRPGLAEGLGSSLQRALALLAAHPAPLLRGFAQRQLLGGLIILSGLGLLLALGGVLPLHASLQLRALRPGEKDRNAEPRDRSTTIGQSLRRLLRPWE